MFLYADVLLFQQKIWMNEFREEKNSLIVYSVHDTIFGRKLTSIGVKPSFGKFF